MPDRGQGVTDGVHPYLVDVDVYPAALAGGEKTLCEQCSLGCEEEDTGETDRNNNSSLKTPKCSQPAGSKYSTLMCVEVRVSERAGHAIPGFQADVHLQRGFCLLDAGDLSQLESMSNVQVKIINDTIISVRASQALRVRFRQVSWQTPPHEPGLVVVRDSNETGQVRYVHSFHGGHDMDRHLPAICHDVTSSHTRECHCLQKACPQRIPSTIVAFQHAINRSLYVHYAELQRMRRGTVTAHLDFSLRETYKDETMRALNSSQAGAELQFVVSLKCRQAFLPAGGRDPSPGHGFWLLGNLVHKIQSRFVYTVNEEVVAVPDLEPREEGEEEEEEARIEAKRRRRNMRAALRNKGLLPQL